MSLRRVLERIDARYANAYRALKDFRITDKGIVKAVDEIEARKLSEWRKATNPPAEGE